LNDLPPPLDETGGFVEPPESPPTVLEKPAIRKLLATLMTWLVIGLFVCVAIQYLYRDSDIARQDFMHLTELLLVLYGTVLGFYFGSQD
jgi:hypothetical protein